MSNSEEYPYGCIELEQSVLQEKYIEWFYSFKQKDIINKSEELLEILKKEIPDKKENIWALFGGKNEGRWICLQVASSFNIKKEIISDIKCMMPLTKEDTKQWSSVFHSDIFPVQYGMDVRCQKYRDMYKRFNSFCIVVINSKKYIKDRDIKEFDLVKYAEVKFAYDTKALYWNPIKEEWNILHILENKN